MILEGGGGGVYLEGKKMNESNSKRAAEQGWSEHGWGPALRFRLQAGVEVRSETACVELGRSRRGAKGMGRDILHPLELFAIWPLPIWSCWYFEWHVERSPSCLQGMLMRTPLRNSLETSREDKSSWLMNSFSPFA